VRESLSLIPTAQAHAEWIKVDREAGQAKEDYEGMVAKSTAALHRFVRKIAREMMVSDRNPMQVSGRQEAAKARQLIQFFFSQ